MLGRTQRIHFVGIGGIGMSGIAELLANLHFAVSGSDLKRSDVTDRLQGLGVTVAVGHAAQHVGAADVVVYSSAVRADNPEIVEAHRRRIPVIPRAEMLAELMRLRSGIAVAGAHGKTTTTSMVALTLERAGLDPTAVIGGRLSAFGSNARLGRGEYMVVEADESDRSFLRLSPTLAVITNIDHEHLEAYRDFDDLCGAFVDFANKVPFYGAIVACLDDPDVRRLAPRFTRRVVTYGLESEDADVRGRDLRIDGDAWVCSVTPGPGLKDALGLATPPSSPLGELRLAVPGRHNILNALAAVVVGLELGVTMSSIAAALAEFHGAERRFQRRGEAAGVLVIDDYGHHPTEIAAVLDAARASLGRRLLVVFQPHRYTRTASLMDTFGPALARADEVILTDIYAAGEDPIPGVTSAALIERASAQMPGRLHLARTLDDAVDAAVAMARPGDAVITLGAGSVSGASHRILAALRETERR
ncbi:MAG: UDP-N-acetylmuramate--L-alanine ligase [Vicinamibacterales bacterium]|nr:UDP-N-acetylmuramate--L-alanine ligase [Vicinamibacterales bacterium]